MKSLGVLGGMGPAATAEFLRLLAADAPVVTDQQHPRIMVLSDPGIPERTPAILAGSDEPLERIRAGLSTLVGWGAELIAVPCNTAHVFVDRVRLPVPVVHIVEATLGAAMAVDATGGWLAASTGTVYSGLYQRRARRLGFRLLIPEERTQSLIHECSVLVKANRMAAATERFTAVAHELWRIQDVPILTACTELPLAAAALPPWKTVSSLAALSAACLTEIYGPSSARSRDSSVS